MPILGSHMQRSAALVVLCIHSCPILEQCPGAQIMTKFASSHQRREAVGSCNVNCCPIHEHYPEDLLEMV